MNQKIQENTFYLWYRVTKRHFAVKKNLKHIHEDVEKLGGKIDKIYWVLLAAAGSAVLFALGVLFK